jgi:hypothetical protein
MENDNKDENHVDDQENDMTNNSKEEEEKTVQNPPIENHDNSRNIPSFFVMKDIRRSDWRFF